MLYLGCSNNITAQIKKINDKSDVTVEYRHIGSPNAMCTTQNNPIEIEFTKVMVVHEIILEGHPKLDKWVKTYKLSYAESTNNFSSYSEV